MQPPDAHSLLKEARVADALVAARQQVAARQADPGLRVLLFQLAALCGRWDEAAAALEVAALQDSGNQMLAAMMTMLIDRERQREAVFSGRESPLIMGEPQPWMGQLVLANELSGRGDETGAAELRRDALAAAPAAPAILDGQSISGFRDTDDRLGPMLEAVVGGKCYWVPSTRLARLEISRPNSLHDLIWAPAIFTFGNEGSVPGHLPVRYAGSEKSTDGEVVLARKTTWRHIVSGFAGLGQRLLGGGDGQDFPLLEIREVSFAAAPAAASEMETRGDTAHV